jgi:hypothetical protein
LAEPPTPEAAGYRAEPIPGPDGTVEWWGNPLTDAAAVARLRQGLDIVVRGPVRRQNRNKAGDLMVAAFGGAEEDQPHGGRMALPHFHPPGRSPEVHAFYESPPRHAKKRKP